MPLTRNRLRDFLAEPPEEERQGWPTVECERIAFQRPRRGEPIVEGWEQLMPRVLAKFTQALLVSRVQALESDVARLKDRIARLDMSRSVIVPIESFSPEPFEPIKAFHVVVELVGDEFVASLYDANINASGENEEEAVTNLKDMILTLFERLQREPAQNLGVGPARQLTVLKGLIRKQS